MKINTTRLLDRIDALAQIGRTERNGSCRIALTDADRAGRDLVVGWMKEIDLDIQVDEVGNIFGSLAGEKNERPIMMGSHIDTVKDGGHLDGCYGVIAALEVIAAYVEHGKVPLHSLCVAIFTNEEGVRFQPDMMGSLVHAGGLSVQEAHRSRSPEGGSLKEELERTGYFGTLKCGSIRPHVFLELHIEQGPLLESRNVAIGAVRDLQGISWTSVTFKGQSNHAGTTPMELRRDAGYAAAQLTIAAREITKRIGKGQVATVGEMHASPNLINVVPGKFQMSVDLRNSDEDKLKAAEALLHDAITDICAVEGVTVETERLVRFQPVEFDHQIADLITEVSEQLGLSCMSMTSGAGHDAQMMARICPSAMIFVPSRDGVSHNPREYTSAEHLSDGAKVLFETIRKLDEA